ncbi:MAG: DNA repair protein RadC [Lachnospiraceae bacterium]|jgi:DNA repair protein RadC|nr:DNA repair protein RadC [Lachnospiraceae bacterium]
MRQTKMERLLPKDQRPYEKCEEKGVRALTNQELLAILLRTGSMEESALELAGRVLRSGSRGEGLAGLCAMTREELRQIHGIGRVKAMQIGCICELARRMAKEPAGAAPRFESPESIAGYYMEDMRHKNQEELMILMLNGRNRRICETVISRGTVNGSVASPREIFLEALRHHAVSIVLLHNHPSGDPTPSQEDILATRRVEEAGALLDVRLLDHIIIGDCCYISLKERGIISI